MFCNGRLCGVLVLCSIQADNQQGDCALSNIRGANRLRNSPNNWWVRSSPLFFPVVRAIPMRLPPDATRHRFRSRSSTRAASVSLQRKSAVASHGRRRAPPPHPAGRDLGPRNRPSFREHTESCGGRLRNGLHVRAIPCRSHPRAMVHQLPSSYPPFGVDIPRISGRGGGMCREVPTLVRARASAYAAYRLLNWKCVER
jgi:hypothetical protein